jgi:hypothetical protein
VVEVNNRCYRAVLAAVLLLLQAYANCPLFGVEYDANASAEAQPSKPL